MYINLAGILSSTGARETLYEFAEDHLVRLNTPERPIVN